jgi:ABC-type uncharacterized transport system substrate-binding protein
MDCPHRRRFVRASLILLACGLLAGCGSPTTRLPPTRVFRIGLFHVGLDHTPPSLTPLRAGLAALGYEEGRTLQLDWSNLPDEEAANLTAREFTDLHLDLIVAFENQTVRAAKAATRDIPIVFLHVDDPVANGWVASLAHPGGNLTGFVGHPDLPEKRLDLLRQAVPELRTLLTLTDPQDPGAPRILVALQRAAALLGLQLLVREASDEAELERIFADLPPGAAQGVIIAAPTLQTKAQSLILRRGLEKGLPLISQRQEVVEQGALLSYGPDVATTGRNAAYRYVDPILRGTHPADLPVEQADALVLAVNLKTARALGLTIPQSVLEQATTIIP